MLCSAIKRSIATGATLAAIIAGPLLAQEWTDPTELDALLEAEDMTGVDFYGQSVAMTAEILVIGCEGDDTTVSTSGGAFVFRWDATDDLWSEETLLEASDGTEWDQFGRSASADENVVVIGAPGRSDGTPFPITDNAGVVYVYRYDEDDEEWTELESLTADETDAADRFGERVAILGDLLLVGAPSRNDEGAGTGAAYLFRYDSLFDTYEEEEKFLASDASAGSNFGNAVAVCAQGLLVGATAADRTFDNAGYAYFYRFDDLEDEWIEQQIEGPDVENHFFGRSFAADGDRLFIGCDSIVGEVRFYEWDADTEEWSETEILTASDEDDDVGLGFGFGASVALDGNLALIGAPVADHLEEDVGAVYVLEWTEDEEWVEIEKLVVDGGEFLDLFGVHIALEAGRAAIGMVLGFSNGLVGGVYTHTLTVEIPFIRGDVDGNGDTSPLVDALSFLAWAFDDGSEPPCLDAADVDDNGSASALVDSLALLQWAFADGEEPPAPGTEECGDDETEDSLTCETPPDCA